MKNSWESILWFKDSVAAPVNVVAWNGTGAVTSDTAFYNRGLLGVAT